MQEERREATSRHISPNYELVDIPFCAAEQYPRLALGVNDVSIFERTLAWDHAAGVLWLNEAGGRAARPDGSPFRVDEVDRTGLLGAASPALWERSGASSCDSNTEDFDASTEEFHPCTEDFAASKHCY